MRAGETVGNARPCVSYLRVSTTRQGTSGLGLEAQREAVAAFLRSGECSELAEEFVEIESGGNDDRPELKRALAAARSRNARLVIAKLDRLGRRAAHVLHLLDKGGVDFAVADMPNADRLTVHILACVAEDEARRISQRTKAALAAAKARGVSLGNPRNLRHADPSEGARVSAEIRAAGADRRAEDLRPVVEKLRTEGRTSLRQIANGLDEAGIPTPRGCTWTASGVRRLLNRIER